MTYGDLRREMKQRLAERYGSHEADAMVQLIFHTLKGWNLTDTLINSNLPVPSTFSEKCEEILSRLGKDEPLQYILGEARFYGMNLKVNRDTLIPRPETAELVDIIVDENRERRDLDILDIGTGSGAIAIALSRNLAFSRITAIDISSGALRVAEENASTLHANVKFLKEDIFLWMPGAESLDIIVSNPPYIAESEKAEMEKNVLDYEPESALFVPDDNPLIYYLRICEVAAEALKEGGELYFELNAAYADVLKKKMQEAGWADVTVLTDSYGKKRFLKTKKR